MLTIDISDFLNKLDTFNLVPIKFSSLETSNQHFYNIKTSKLKMVIKNSKLEKIFQKNIHVNFVFIPFLVDILSS